jgi:hypothetical protein
VSDYDEPELAGYEPGDGRPLRGRRVIMMVRVVVVLGIIGLVLPGLITTVSVGAATAEEACAAWVAYEAPDSKRSNAVFELFGAGGPGWQCYSVGAFGGDRNVASLGLIPVSPKLASIPRA